MWAHDLSIANLAALGDRYEHEIEGMGEVVIGDAVVILRDNREKILHAGHPRGETVAFQQHTSEAYQLPHFEAQHGKARLQQSLQ